jgi:hypothetical protein
MYALLEKYEDLKKEALCLQEILNMMPFSIYWKNIYGKYMGINGISLENMKAIGKNIESNKIIGSYDNQLFDARSAFRFQRHDQLVIAENKPNVFRETICKPKQYSGFSYKLPLLNSYGEINGSIGLSSSLHLSKSDMHDQAQTYIKKIFINEKVFSLTIFELEKLVFKISIIKKFHIKLIKN